MLDSTAFLKQYVAGVIVYKQPQERDTLLKIDNKILQSVVECIIVCMCACISHMYVHTFKHTYYL